MKDFYTNVNCDIDPVYKTPINDEVLAIGYDNDGKRYKTRVPFKETGALHMYVEDPSKSSEFRTIDGKYVTRIDFETDKDIRGFKNGKKVEDIDGKERQLYHGQKTYGLHSSPSYKNACDYHINNTWDNQVPYDFSKMTVANIDIETDSSEGFTYASLAAMAILTIALQVRGVMYVFGCNDFTPKEKHHHYIKCKDEADLLEKFLKFWSSLEIDIVTGWNVEFFDVPYLVNRIARVLGKKYPHRLSPWHGIVKSNNLVREGRMESHRYDKKPVGGRGEIPAGGRGRNSTWGEMESYEILGISILDYMVAYKKFTYTQQESYSLNNIASVELNEKKLDYSEQDSLHGLYKNDYQKFVEYNIKDVELVGRLDDKMKLLELMAAISYDGHVNLNDAFTSVRLWDIIIHNYLLKKKIVVPKLHVNEKHRQNPGGFVKDPIKGIQEWIVSFDLNSLYPHLIMQYNISPETYKGPHKQRRLEKYDITKTNPITKIEYKIGEGWRPDPVENIKMILEEGYKDIDNPDDCTIGGSGMMYSKDIRGFLPTLMERTYKDRVVWKDKMKAAIADGNENEIARCDNMQMAKKIQLNSAYGALANPAFRWHKMDHAEAITLSGQLAIQWIEKKINIYMNDKFKTQNEDYVIAIDTDSVYVTFEKMVDKTKPIPDNVEMLHQFVEKTMEPNIDKWYQELADYTNAYEQKMIMKREVIADKGIWTAKKHYALNVWDTEGQRHKEPKRKIMGLESVKSSTPLVCRKAIEISLEIMLNENQDAFVKYIAEFKERFKTLPYEEIAFPRGISDIDKWVDNRMEPKKGTPIHVKGAIAFNRLIKEYELDTRYDSIGNGGKIKFCYLKLPNITRGHVISCPSILPKQFGLDKYIDYDKQFEKSFQGPMETIAEAAGWQTEKISTLEDFWK
jgi:DNA polymerase elongation subunit (family B)